MRFRCLAVGLVILAAVGVWRVRAGQESGTQSESRQDAADLTRHGVYLVSSATMCGDCHTPQEDGAHPDRTRLLRGATLPIRPKKETRD
jgi:cytochrome c553